MESVQETLIAIASASKRVIDALRVRARNRKDSDRNHNLSHKQLEGDLQRIVAASQTLLAETLEHSSLANPAVDDRLETWLSSKEPKICLGALQEMEALTKSSSSDGASTLRNFFVLAPIEDKLKQAIQIFKKNRVYFYFLLNTNVWNHETVIMSQPKGHPINTQSIRQGLVGRKANSAEPSWKKKIWSEADRTWLKEVSEWLDAWNSTKHQDTLDLRQPDTCTWLPDTDEYQTWRYANDGFLWLHGKPGSGKSVLAASVIDDIQNTMDKGELLAFFYCDFRSERSTVAAEVMRSLLSQLLQGLCDLGVDPGDILDVLAKEMRQQHTILGKSKRLAALVSRVAKQYPRPPLVVVDALDECEDLENLLGSLLDLNKGGVRLLVISRPLQVVKYRFSGLPWLSLEQMSKKVYADIRLHVRREIDSHIWLRDARTTLKEEIIGRLCSEADGMFRWIECQLNTLKECFTTSEIRKVLDSLPVDLDETYRRILLAISKEERGGVIAKRALIWVVTALRPLRLNQIIEALSIDLDLRALNPDSAPIHGRALLHSLSSLVIHSEGVDIVQLSRFSVKEYLVGDFTKENHMYHIDLRDAHAQVWQQCMSYITACLTFRPQDSHEHPLLGYVLEHGFYHLSHVEPTDRILDSIVALHRDIQQHPSEWEQLRKGVMVQTYELPSSQHDFVLYSLIRCAPDPLLHLFLCRSPLAEKDGINPLIYVVPGKIEHARTLLAHGAKLSFCGRFIQHHHFSSGLPIEAAARAGDLELVDLFLEEGSPVPHRLLSAHFFGRWEGEDPYDSIPDIPVLARLLQTDEFMEWAIDDLNKLLVPALHCVAQCLNWSSDSVEGDVVVMARRFKQIGCDLAGHTSFVEALLRHAAHAGDISSIQHLLSDLKMQLPPDILLDTTGSLRLLNHSCDAETTRFLIQNGANIHVVSADESTALHDTVRDSYDTESILEKTKVLCAAGCSPSMCNLQGQTPMHIAVNRNDLSVVRHFLSVSALIPPDILFASDSSLYSSRAEGLSSSMTCFLLGEGADARAVAANGDSVLHSALRYRSTDDSVARLESARMLVAAGCDLRIKNSFGQTSLDIAVANGHVSVVRYLLSLNIPFSPDVLLSASSSACSRLNRWHDPGDFSVMIRLLLKHGADPNVNTPNGDNALHLAMTNGNWGTWEVDGQYIFQAVKILVAAGCDPSACNAGGRTVLHTAAAQGYTKIMEYLLSLGVPIPPDILLILPFGSRATTRVIQLLIDKGVDVPAGGTADGNTPLRSFFSSSDYLLSLSMPLPPDILLSVSVEYSVTVIRFLIDKGADATAITAEGDTTLHLALRTRSRNADSESLLKIAKILIDAGCDMNACNHSDGDTPLHIAASRGHLDIIKYLLSRGASLPPDVMLPTVTRGDIHTMEYLLSQGASVPPSAFLEAASCVDSSNNVRAVWFISTLNEADVRIVAPNGDTALHRAVNYGNEGDCLETAKLLVHLGCHLLSLCNSNGETPLHIAARRHHISVLKYLLSQGIPLPSDVLLSAVSFGSKAAAMVRLLIREGANPCVVNDKGDSPLHVLLRRNFKLYGDGKEQWKVIQMLLDAGANPYLRNLYGQTPVDLAEKPGPFFRTSCDW